LVCASPEERKQLIDFLETRSIHAVFHYQALHSSAYYSSLTKEIEMLPNAELFSERLLRLPLFYELTDNEVDYICDSVSQFFINR
jgi:dTDP-4-amino-4,6-dideoxygalactose transaminase